jgi:hypothetical protein
MSLNDFSTITVSTSAPSLTQVGFGTLGIMSYHTNYTDHTRVYDRASWNTQMVTDGFATNGAAYVAMQVAFSQNPSVQKVKLLRAEHEATVTVKFFPTVANSTEYAATLELEGKSPVTISYTSDSSATAAEITAGLKAAIDALNSTGEALDGVTATQTDTNTKLQVAAPAGMALWFSGWRNDRMTFIDLTADPGIAADIAAVRAVDDDWYAFGLADTNSVAASTVAAAQIEAMTKIFGTNTSDTNAYDLATTTDIGSVLASNSYQRSFALFDLDTTKGFSGIASCANLLPFDPGTGPFAGGVLNGRTLGGVTADALTPTQHDNLRTKGYSIYITTAGINHVLGGEAGSGEWIDFTRFVDWFTTRLQERLAQLQFNNRRIPFTDRGISQVYSVLRGMIASGLASGGIAEKNVDGISPYDQITVPALADTTVQDRGDRVLNGCALAFEYSGAIQKVGVSVTITE